MADKTITKRDSVALWHAVEALSELVWAMRDLEGFTAPQTQAEVNKLRAARVALRKVQAIVRAQKRGES